MNVDDATADLQALRAQLHRLQQDLAAEREARERAEEEGRRKDEFLAMVAHELRAPLGAILGWAHMLRRRGGEEEFETALQVIEQSVQVQNKLVDDLLVMSRTASTRMSLRPELVDPHAIVGAAIEAVRPAVGQKELLLRESYDPSAGPVRADPTRLQQVMTNLLTNAVKFTPPGGCVEVTLRRSHGWAVIAVSDTGIGIPPAFLPHVFERFRRGAAAARSHGGLGLGLAIARHLVELHGGEIEAASDGEGHGSTFVVRLPLAEAAGR
jgi:signal transduction histidine kinase